MGARRAAIRRAALGLAAIAAMLLGWIAWGAWTDARRVPPPALAAAQPDEAIATHPSPDGAPAVEKRPEADALPAATVSTQADPVRTQPPLRSTPPDPADLRGLAVAPLPEGVRQGDLREVPGTNLKVLVSTAPRVDGRTLAGALLPPVGAAIAPGGTTGSALATAADARPLAPPVVPAGAMQAEGVMQPPALPEVREGSLALPPPRR